MDARLLIRRDELLQLVCSCLDLAAAVEKVCLNAEVASIVRNLCDRLFHQLQHRGVIAHGIGAEFAENTDAQRGVGIVGRAVAFKYMTAEFTILVEFSSTQEEQ